MRILVGSYFEKDRILLREFNITKKNDNSIRFEDKSKNIFEMNNVSQGTSFDKYSHVDVFLICSPVVFSIIPYLEKSLSCDFIASISTILMGKRLLLKGLVNSFGCDVKNKYEHEVFSLNTQDSFFCAQFTPTGYGIGDTNLVLTVEPNQTQLLTIMNISSVSSIGVPNPIDKDSILRSPYLLINFEPVSNEKTSQTKQNFNRITSTIQSCFEEQVQLLLLFPVVFEGNKFLLLLDITIRALIEKKKSRVQVIVLENKERQNLLAQLFFMQEVVNATMLSVFRENKGRVQIKTIEQLLLERNNSTNYKCSIIFLERENVPKILECFRTTKKIIVESTAEGHDSLSSKLQELFMPIYFGISNKVLNSLIQKHKNLHQGHSSIILHKELFEQDISLETIRDSRKSLFFPEVLSKRIQNIVGFSSIRFTASDEALVYFSMPNADTHRRKSVEATAKISLKHEDLVITSNNPNLLKLLRTSLKDFITESISFT